MSNRHVQAIGNRLSLRPPQRESLDLLAQVMEAIQPAKGQDVPRALETFRAAFPDLVGKGFTDFDRDFPSFCFSLATGVGKTRLMGAFISYLYVAHGIRHFFVLAPNLTIYEKLYADFSNRTSPKYVFQGIAEFAQEPPNVVTGDTYEAFTGSQADLLGDIGTTINIFNISKINSEVRGGKEPRVKRAREVLGDSYFNYLANLPDLVLLMDESHRYRASQGVRAINELNPILGLELTATPKVKSGSAFVPFKNVVYSYPLNRAIADGFVKEPAVATRENFDATQYKGDDGKLRLEKLKLEDGIRVHESVKVDLEAYAGQHGRAVVKPFILVVAQDTTHAEELRKLIEDDSFFEGRYKGKAITVHSNQSGEEKDENVQRLLAVEDPNEPTEIVIHVNKLQEGWDVRNLYTIVPLRASASDILTEQTIGRGLRLPYERKTGVKALDRLTIVAHEHFQRIIDDANRPDSIIKSGVVIGRDIPIERRKVVESKPKIYDQITEQADIVAEAGAGKYGTPAVNREAMQQTIEVIKRLERLPSTTDFTRPEVVQQIRRDVTALMAAKATGDIVATVEAKANLAPAVDAAIKLYADQSIRVPKIVIEPKDSAEAFFTDFDLDARGINLQPVEHAILIKHLQSQQTDRVHSGTGIIDEPRLENYIVRNLIDRNDVSYDDHADLLYKLAGQAVARVQSYLAAPDEVLNVLQYYGAQLADLIYGQMVAHKRARVVEYVAKVTQGSLTLRGTSHTCMVENGERNFREPLDEKKDIRSIVFNGFEKCLYQSLKFDSDPERRLAILLEDEDAVLKWFKPASGDFSIFYHKDHRYEPDFVVETASQKLLCETKDSRKLTDADIQAKRAAAIEWCRHATKHELQNGGKPWKYLLIPHEEVRAERTLRQLVEAFGAG